jgi:hypothetical protein
VCCIFDVSQGRSVEGKPTLASNIQNEDDDWMARAGGDPEATRVIFKSIRFQTVNTPSSVGQRSESQGLKPRTWVRTMPGPTLVFLFSKLTYFQYFLLF